MASVDGITVAKAQEIEDASVVTGVINILTGHLILTTAGGVDIDAGLVVDPTALANHLADTSTHGVGEVVGRTENQTLTNKNLTDPTIGSFINAQHAHGGSAAGGPLFIGKADSPAPVTVLTAQNLADGDPAKVMASLSCPAGRWLILAACEGVTMGANTFTKFTYDLKSTAGFTTFTAKQSQASSSVMGMEAGRQLWGWLDTPSTVTVTFTIVKNGTGALVTNSTIGALLAIRMG